MEKNPCKICGAERKKIFEKKILEKHDVSYFECSKCGFIQTEKPYWLDEAYSSAITSVDVGLVYRNIYFSDIVEKILQSEVFDKNARFLDFAGGYGLFVRVMRDKGFDFYREDKYCDNLFAKYFDIKDLSEKDQAFELVTAFELMEHAENPFKELDYIFSMTESFLFSTELIPDENVEDWWYIGAEHGQHISFYTKESLKKIAEKYGKTYFPYGNLHLIAGKNCEGVFGKIDEGINPSKKMKSRLWDDFQMVLKKTKNEA
jgi:hypothetical protein